MRIGSSHTAGLPNQNARAVGLVRKLEDGTFKGASIDCLRDKFAHRLTATSENTTGPDGLTEPTIGLSIAPTGSRQILDLLA
jgi:hypothetical protein